MSVEEHGDREMAGETEFHHDLSCEWRQKYKCACGATETGWVHEAWRLMDENARLRQMVEDLAGPKQIVVKGPLRMPTDLTLVPGELKHVP